MKKNIVPLAVISMTLAGCAVSPTREQQVDIDDSIPICYGASDCKVKWAAARDWVIAHSTSKIQTYSDDFIETYNVPEYSPQLAVRVTKKPLLNLPDGRDAQAIHVYVSCRNALGCSPPVAEALLSFNNEVARADLTDPSCYAGMLGNGIKPLLGLFLLELKGGRGLILKRVCFGSPAYVAGLRANDTIVSIQGEKISTQKQLIESLAGVSFGETLSLTANQAGEFKDFKLTIPSREELNAVVMNSMPKAIPAAGETNEAKLEELSRLYSKGLISKAEFEEKRKVILDRM